MEGAGSRVLGGEGEGFRRGGGGGGQVEGDEGRTECERGWSLICCLDVLGTRGREADGCIKPCRQAFSTDQYLKNFNRSLPRSLLNFNSTLHPTKAFHFNSIPTQFPCSPLAGQGHRGAAAGQHPARAHRLLQVPQQRRAAFPQQAAAAERGQRRAGGPGRREAGAGSQHGGGGGGGPHVEAPEYCHGHVSCAARFFKYASCVRRGRGEGNEIRMV